METQERAYVVDNLVASETRLLELTEGLTAAQWNFKESGERWSIAEILEHCIVTDQAVGGLIQHALSKPAEPAKKALAAGKDEAAKRVGDPTGHKIAALEQLLPTGRWDDPAAMIAAMRKVRAVNVAFAQSTEADLRSHFAKHEQIGEMDCYQWLILMGQHGERHAKQIERVKAAAGYPG